MRNKFKIHKTSVMRDKNHFLLEGTLTSGSIAVGMNLQFSDYHGNVELLPIADIGFVRMKKAGRVTELMVLCIPYEDEWMLRNYQNLELEGRSFSVSRPLFRSVYQQRLASTREVSVVAEPQLQYGKTPPVKKNRTASAGKKSKTASGRSGSGTKRAAKKKK